MGGKDTDIDVYGNNTWLCCHIHRQMGGQDIDFDVTLAIMYDCVAMLQANGWEGYKY